MTYQPTPDDIIGPVLIYLAIFYLMAL